MKAQTHLKLQLREIIVNWNYIDTIIFMVILLTYVGFTDPCDRCMVNLGYGQMSCKDAFMQKIGYVENDVGVFVKNDYNNLNLSLENLTINKSLTIP